ncbi:hypothetical protein SODALDRAFT_188487 [Sodiomyces alkalinus F11]|uniref:Mitochondrial phosphate carrier protein n=1 Tax=Sodiomyces alkalinus (strain CBS 110278 / VKM F-3762 / F11) TaxID=1314773 RepID=A0A3N2PRX1_SODAK|nr:hypothetical protein SODALDRAFT_188487 [Sodiomyces alkalinus F11]ROT37116.1 hypothetical protein SODALDRAFT_188487 [Sodiomyces alkalinus F11]
MWLTRTISMTNFAVASSALAFQVFVLYPWHEELQRDFNNLQKEHKTALEAVKLNVEELRREHIRVLDAVKADLEVQKGKRSSVLAQLTRGHW